MQRVLNVGLGLLIIPSLLIVLIPLVDTIFDLGFISYLDQIMTSLNTVIGSNNVNYMFIILGLIMFIYCFRFLIRFLTSFK